MSMKREFARSYYIVDRGSGCDTPTLIGPFPDADLAEAYAERYHPDEGDGGVWILQAVPPLREAL